MVYAQDFLINIHYTAIYFPFYSTLMARRAVELTTKTTSYKISAGRNTSEALALAFLLFGILPMKSNAITVFLISRGMVNSPHHVFLWPV